MSRALSALCLLVLAGALVAAGGARGSSQGGLQLVPRKSENGYRVKVPAGWRYRDATYPSDHSTEFWFDPRDFLSKIEIVGSACVGCVVPPKCLLRNVGCRPAPENLVPKDAVSRTRIGKWAIRYETFSIEDPYPQTGLVVVAHEGSEIRGSFKVDVWLPESRRALARAIVGSFTPVP